MPATSRLAAAPIPLAVPSRRIVARPPSSVLIARRRREGARNGENYAEVQPADLFTC